MSKKAAIAQFQNDVAAVIAGADPESQAQPGRMMAPRGISLDQIKQGFDRFADAFGMFGPILVTLTPAQYKPFVIAVAKLIELADGAVNPAPAPAPDAKPLRAAVSGGSEPGVAVGIPADPAADVPTEVVETT